MSAHKTNKAHGTNAPLRPQHPLKTLTKPLVLLLVMVMAFSALSGCSRQVQHLPDEKNVVLKNLEKKYGEEFVGAAVEELSVSNLYYVYPKKGGRKDGFAARPDGSKYRVSDNYYGVKIKPQYEAVVRELLNKDFKDYKLELEMVNNTTFSGALGVDTPLDKIYETTLKEWKKQHVPWSKEYMVIFKPDIKILVSESTVKDMEVVAAATEFLEGMAEKKLACSFEIVVIKDEDYVKFPDAKAYPKQCYIGMVSTQDLSVEARKIQ